MTPNLVKYVIYKIVGFAELLIYVFYVMIIKLLSIILVANAILNVYFAKICQGNAHNAVKPSIVFPQQRLENA